MYIAPYDDFAFIHINKTGGRSATAFMQENVRGFYRVALHFVHKPLSFIGQEWYESQKRILSIIRNPYDRYESLYFYRRQKYRQGNEAGQNVDAYEMDFPEWMDLILDSGEILDGTQDSFLNPWTDNLHVIKLENLHKELCAFLNLDPCRFKTPHVNKSKREPVKWPTLLKRDVYDLEESIFQHYPEEVRP